MIPRARIDIYRASDGWRWNARAGNSKIIGSSEEGHRSKARALRKAKAQFPDLPAYIIAVRGDEPRPVVGRFLLRIRSET